MTEEKDLETTRGETAAEAPKEENPQAEAPKTAARSGKPQKPVYIYLIALFAVALLLMSLSFLMNHRSNQQIIGELRENVNSLQLLQEAEEQNAALSQRIRELESEIGEQRETIFELRQEVASLQRQLAEAENGEE